MLPHEEDQHKIHGLVQQGIEKQFQVSATLENRSVDVYVMTAIDGKTPAAKSGGESFGGSSISWSGPDIALPAGTPPTMEALRKARVGRISNVSATNTTMEGFAGCWKKG